MKKEYTAPEVEIIRFTPKRPIMGWDETQDGGIGQNEDGTPFDGPSSQF